MGKTSRNAPCHCGSGKKYKNCHRQVDGQKQVKSKSRIALGIIVIFIIISAIAIFWNSQTSGSAAPGEAPAGKVWSPEHGHWHDA